MMPVVRIRGLDITQFQFEEQDHRRTNCQGQRVAADHLRVPKFRDNDDDAPLTGGLNASAHKNPHEVGPERRRPAVPPKPRSRGQPKSHFQPSPRPSPRAPSGTAIAFELQSTPKAETLRENAPRVG